MKIKKKYIVKYIKLLTDTSAFRLVKEFHIQGDYPLKAIPVFLDSLWCKLRYGMSTKEYFYFSFYNKSGFARKQFISSAEHTWTTVHRINKGDKSLFEQKINAYQSYKEYYRREVLKINLPTDTTKLFDFAAKHGGFIMKPLNESQGHGIQFWNKALPDAYEKLQMIAISTMGEVIVEEIIQQDEAMAAFHPSSVNTIRYVVDYNEEGVNRLWAIIRIGVGDSHIDNTSAGGICAGIDLETGIIISPAVRRNGEQFLLHPDSGKQIIGTKIPKWQELNEIIPLLRPKDSPVHLVGWDFALSKSGWCIVEGNACPSAMGIQGAMNKGYRAALKRVKSNNRK